MQDVCIIIRNKRQTKRILTNKYIKSKNEKTNYLFTTDNDASATISTRSKPDDHTQKRHVNNGHQPR